jgi:outer membrane protein assembly factor BamA
LRLRGALLKSVTVVAMIAAIASQASARLPKETAQTQSPTEASQPNFESVSSYQGLTVTDIKIPGVAESDQKPFRQLLVQETGKPLDRELIRESIQALYNTGRYSYNSWEHYN